MSTSEVLAAIAADPEFADWCEMHDASLPPPDAGRCALCGEPCGGLVHYDCRRVEFPGRDLVLLRYRREG